jgi:hypothetical protein
VGIRLNLVTLGDGNIGRILDDPPLVWQAIAPDNPYMYETARAEQKKPGLLARLFGRGKHDGEVPDLEMSPAEGTSIDLDKAWQGIHFLLTGTAWEGEYPLSFLVNGGRFVGNIDVGLGPARVFTTKETREVFDALDALSDEVLKARFDMPAMIANGVFPWIWKDEPPPEDETVGSLTHHLQVLRGFLRQAVNDKVGMVVFF